MARRNNAKLQKTSRRGRWSEASRMMLKEGEYPDLPDVGSGADPTSGAPAPFKHKGRRTGHNRRSAGGAAR